MKSPLLHILHLLCLIPALLSISGCSTTSETGGTGNRQILHSSFIYESAPFPSCHASTIVETRNGFLAAWFGGTAESNPDVTIWTARFDGRSWSTPVEVATGVQADGKRFPCWNPVLTQTRDGSTWLFYKVGPNPRQWWGMIIESRDQGRTWSQPRKLPDGILGPIKNKPEWLADGRLLCPSSSEHDGWKVHMESTRDGVHWESTAALNDGKEFGAIQPSILFHGKNRLQILCRSRQQAVTECWSEDGGKTWGSMQKTTLPNPNSGTDAVTLRDGRQLIVYNPTVNGRTPLQVGISPDGKNWSTAVVLETEPGEYSYPAVIQARDGKIHITYTWNRKKIRHVVLNPRTLSQ